MLSQPERRLITQATFAKERGCSRSNVSQLIKAGTIGLDAIVDGKLDADRAHEQVDARTDPGRRKPRPASPAKLPSGFACLENVEDHFEAGMKLMGLMLAYALPAYVAVWAVDCGASMKTCYALLQHTRVGGLFVLEDRLRDFKLIGDGRELTCNPDAFDDVDWHKIAASVGEQVDIPEWEAFSRKVGMVEETEAVDA